MFFKRELVFLVAVGIILGFYVLFFVILQLEDLTLLVGTLGLFVLLAIYFTGSIQDLESDRNFK
ncbi:inner membrane CreD family protein [Leptospira stimsonii]|uniref:inner membrane CreD family protein n=1 Tax=Leptospira stimsonii TaxID=2202203 RepID=UPI003D2D2F2D